MSHEIPYALYLKFKEPADAKTLSNVFEFIGLGFLGEDEFDGLFKVQHYHFKNDPSKKILLHVETENNISERINISIYSGASLENIKELFQFFTDNFEEEQVTLIDQEIKNDLLLRTFIVDEEGEGASEARINTFEKTATLPFSFDAFYQNATNLEKRNALLGKTGPHS